MAKKPKIRRTCKSAGESASDEEAAETSVKVKKKKEYRSAGPTPEFATARDFAKAIAIKRNLVEVGSALLGSEETKGASVRARMFETTLEYLYGKPAAAQPELPVRVVWDIPMLPPDEPKE
jgi:hypothetical protein